jgi:hypothetical protein
LPLQLDVVFPGRSAWAYTGSYSGLQSSKCRPLGARSPASRSSGAPLAGQHGTQPGGWRACQSRKAYCALDLRHNTSVQQILLIGILSTERAQFISPVTSTSQHSKEPSGKCSTPKSRIFNPRYNISNPKHQITNELKIQ